MCQQNSHAPLIATYGFAQGRLGVKVNLLYTVYVVAKLPNSGTTQAKGRRELAQHGVLPSFAEGEWPGRRIFTVMDGRSVCAGRGCSAASCCCWYITKHNNRPSRESHMADRVVTPVDHAFSAGTTYTHRRTVYITEYRGQSTSQSSDCRFPAYIPSLWKNQPWLVRVGVHAHPLSAYYHHVQSCSVRSLYFFATLCVLCGLHHSKTNGVTGEHRYIIEKLRESYVGIFTSSSGNSYFVTLL
jgi:hypothetical protein